MNKRELKVRESVTQIEKEICEKEELIKNTREEVATLRKQLQKLKNSLLKADYFQTLESFLQSATEFEELYLDRSISTRQMMTDLRRGQRDVGGTKKQRNKRIDYYIFNWRYIVVYPLRHGIPLINEESHLTITEFKQNSRHILEMPSIKRKISLQSGKRASLFIRPIVLNAQTYDDMDYRKEWQNGELVYEGNNYGDTTLFYIVGVID